MESDWVKYCWMVRKDYDPGQHIGHERMKAVCAIWGSWQSWRTCATDNIIVEDFADARRLLDRELHTRTNMWTHEENFDLLGRPDTLSLHNITIDKSLRDKNDLVALALSAARHEIVMCAGFDLTFDDAETDRLERHEQKRFLSAVANIAKGFDQTQFVFIDLPGEPAENFEGLSNVTRDSMDNVLALVSTL